MTDTITLTISREQKMLLICAVKKNLELYGEYEKEVARVIQFNENSALSKEVKEELFNEQKENLEYFKTQLRELKNLYEVLSYSGTTTK